VPTRLFILISNCIVVPRRSDIDMACLLNVAKYIPPIACARTIRNARREELSKCSAKCGAIVEAEHVRAAPRMTEADQRS